MTCPMIPKPLALSPNEAVGLILLLNTPLLEGVELQDGSEPLRPLDGTVIRGLRLAEYRHSPLKGSQDGSAIGAFLACTKENKFIEWSR
jgi:hypothetical protein